MIREHQHRLDSGHHAEPGADQAVPIVYVMKSTERGGDDLQQRINALGYLPRFCSSLEELARIYQANVPSCLIIDDRFGTMTSGDVLSRIPFGEIKMPALVLIDQGDAGVILKSFRRGAQNVLVESEISQEFDAAVRLAVDRDAALCSTRSRKLMLAGTIETLSDGERDVLQRVCDGMPNKVIASRLGISRRAVEDRRSKIMRKLHAESVADLVRLVMESHS